MEVREMIDLVSLVEKAISDMADDETLDEKTIDQAEWAWRRAADLVTALQVLEGI